MFLPATGAELAVYLINLDRAPDRLARMTDRLDRAGMPFERVSATDGRALQFPLPEFSPLSYMLLHGRRTVPSEVGCYLSHIDCARRLLASGASHALILEDDAELPDDMVELIDAAIGAADDWDILRLSSVNGGPMLPFRRLTAERQLAVALFREKGAGAYVINRRAADWFVRRQLPMRLAWDIAFDLEYLAGLSAAFVVPVPVNQRSEAVSQIQDDVPGSKLPRWRYLTVLPYRAWLELTRLVLRGGRYVWLRLRARSLKTRRSP